MPRPNKKSRGKGNQRGGGAWNRGGGRNGASNRGTERTNKADVVRHNEKYVRYYNSLGLVPEEEQEAFWTYLKTDLPNSFRFTGSKAHALAVQQRLKDFYIPDIVSIKHDGDFVEAPRPVEWYPDQLAWYMTVPKMIIRRFAPFANFQKFLVAENDVGNISRQEVVSMIPPLLMDIKPNMTVLDLCAAPGSKSAQLLEMVLGGQEERTAAVADVSEDGGADTLDYEDDGRSTGLLIANDVDYKRAHMLVHQLKRLSSANLIVMNHDATVFPSIKLPPNVGPDGNVTTNRYLKFDRILADVPCSGDGTVRKNLEIWKNWTPQNGLGLHTIQTRILVRALQMLKAGGRVVYSTCSMNPIEDEAVLVAAIDRCGGPEKVKLLDCTTELPGLKRYTGLEKWAVMDRDGKLWNTYEDVQESRRSREDAATSKLTETMFAPTRSDLVGIPLQHAMRIYPHSHNTGAFFIAVLEKTSEIRAKPENEDGQGRRAPNAARNGNDEPNEALNDTVPLPKDDEENGEDQGLKRQAPSDDEGPRKRAKSSPDPQTLAHPLPSKPPMPAIPNHPEAPKLESELPQPVAMDQPESAAAPASHPLPQKPPVGGRRNRDQPFEEPFKYLSPDIPELEQIRNFYSISKKFPMDRFMVRNATGTASKNVYYTTELARDILRENEGKGLKFVHSGVIMFVKQSVPNPDMCPWRIQTDGLPLLERWVGDDRIVTLRKRETLRKLLVEMFPKFSGDAWKDLGEVGPQVREKKMGCCVMRVEPGEGDDDLKEYMVFPLWKSLHSLNLMLPKEDRRALLLRLFNDETPLVNPMKDPKQKPGDSVHGTAEISNNHTQNGGASVLDAVQQELDQKADQAIEEEMPDMPVADDAGNTSSEDGGAAVHGEEDAE